MKREASFWKKIDDKKVRCSLCSHKCKISEGKVGVCGVRKNENGKLYTLIYGSASSIASDPIEKKPLYHFYPGTYAFSMGTVGCNFKCNHCQNYSISTANSNFPHMKEITPEIWDTDRMAIACFWFAALPIYIAYRIGNKITRLVIDKIDKD